MQTREYSIQAAIIPGTWWVWDEGDRWRLNFLLTTATIITASTTKRNAASTEGTIISTRRERRRKEGRNV